MTPFVASHRRSFGHPALASFVCAVMLAPGLARAHGGEELFALLEWIVVSPLLAVAMVCFGGAYLARRSRVRSRPPTDLSGHAATTFESLGAVALFFVIRMVAPMPFAMSATVTLTAVFGLLNGLRSYVGLPVVRVGGHVDSAALNAWLSERERTRAEGGELGLRGLRAWTDRDVQVLVVVFALAMLVSTWRAGPFAACVGPVVAALSGVLIRWIFRHRVFSFTNGTLVLTRPWDGARSVPLSDVLAWVRSDRGAWLHLRLDSGEAWVAMPPDSSRS